MRVFDRDQQAAGALYRVYRLVRLRGQVSRRAPLTTDLAAERPALLTYAVEDAGVPTPRLRALLRVGPEALVLATDDYHGTSLAELRRDADRRPAGAGVGRGAPAARAPGRPPALTSDRILSTATARSSCSTRAAGTWPPVICSCGWTCPSCSPSSPRWSGRTGPRTWRCAKSGRLSWSTLVPLLQPVVLARSTRSALRRDKDVLPALRKRLLATAPHDGGRGPAGPAGADPAPQPDHAGGHHPRGLPADRPARPGQLRDPAQVRRPAAGCWSRWACRR